MNRVDRLITKAELLLASDMFDGDPVSVLTDIEIVAESSDPDSHELSPDTARALRRLRDLIGREGSVFNE